MILGEQVVDLDELAGAFEDPRQLGHLGVSYQNQYEVYAKQIGLVKKYYKDLQISNFDTLNKTHKWILTNMLPSSIWWVDYQILCDGSLVEEKRNPNLDEDLKSR